MHAISFDTFAELPGLIEVTPPRCEPRGVVIRVGATGLCRSDWHAWMGHDDSVALPHIPGHEFAGTIEEVGAEVTRWTVGDLVTVPFICACGDCPECLSGNQQLCDRQRQPGFTDPGSFAELVAVPEADLNVVALPDTLDFVSAAGLGCRFATAWRAVMTQGRVAPDEWVVVHGCGGVGLSAVMIAVAAGARVVAVDLSSEALEWAARLGATPVRGGEDVVADVRAATAGGAHLSLDTFGSATTCANSVLSLRKRGRHVQVGLMMGDDALAPLPMAPVIAGELELLGSHGMAAHEYPAMLEAIATGAIDPSVLVGTVIDLEAAPAALAGMGSSARPGMTVISLG